MKKVINNILGSFGYQIRATHAPLQSFETGMMHIARLFPVDTVVDIGVAHNTNDLYGAFSGKNFLLIEANPEFKTHLAELKARLNAKVEMVFCGEKSGEISFNLPKNGRRASAYSENSSDLKSITVKTEALDDLMERNGLSEGAVLIKIDVEGAELDVLKGAAKTLGRSNVVILEICWGVPFAPNAADYTDLLVFMKERGFTLYNIVEGGGILRHDRLTHADFIFVRSKTANSTL